MFIHYVCMSFFHQIQHHFMEGNIITVDNKQQTNIDNNNRVITDLQKEHI